MFLTGLIPVQAETSCRPDLVKKPFCKSLSSSTAIFKWPQTGTNGNQILFIKTGAEPAPNLGLTFIYGFKMSKNIYLNKLLTKP
jgi:hypothetical protein